jgi:hypothetical protein
MLPAGPCEATIWAVKGGAEMRNANDECGVRKVSEMADALNSLPASKMFPIAKGMVTDLLKEIADLVKKSAAEQKTDKDNWGHVGSMIKVRDDLDNIRAFLANEDE